MQLCTAKIARLDCSMAVWAMWVRILDETPPEKELASIVYSENVYFLNGIVHSFCIHSGTYSALAPCGGHVNRRTSHCQIEVDCTNSVNKCAELITFCMNSFSYSSPWNVMILWYNDGGTVFRDNWTRLVNRIWTKKLNTIEVVTQRRQSICD